MQYLESLKAYESQAPCVVTFGKFDGLHLGHQKLVEKTVELAGLAQIPSVVCAFDMGLGDQLLTKEERRQMLEPLVDVLVNCPFTPELEKMEAEDFLRESVRDRFHAACVVVGTDFRFGYRKRGDVRLLQELAGRYGYEPVILKKECYEGREISSTYIKEALNQGNLSLVNRLLGYEFFVSGEVEYGKQLAGSLGFPTVNVWWPENKIVPPKGVYMTRTRVDDAWYPGVSNVGVKPTVCQDGQLLLESHLFGYSENAYGKTICTQFLEYIRPEQKYDTVADLQSQVDVDIAFGKKFFKIEN